MGSIFGGFAWPCGAIALVMSLFIGLIGLLPFGLALFWLITALAIILAILGFVKDDTKAYAVVGFIFGIAAIVLSLTIGNFWLTLLPS